MANSSSEIMVVWRIPTVRDGIIRRYDLNVTSEKGYTNSTPVVCSMTQRADMEPSNCNEIQCYPDQEIFVCYLRGLHPFRNYTVDIAATTTETGEITSATEQTDEDVPGMPRNLSATNITYQSVSLNWMEPEEKNGIITQYNLCFDFKTQSECKEAEINTTCITVTTEKRNYTVMDMYPFWNYNFKISANTSKGEGQCSEISRVKTSAFKPDPVENFRITTLKYNTTVNWEQPCYFNGDQNGYKICLENATDDIIDSSLDGQCNITSETQTVVQTLPFRTYVIYVFALNTKYQSNVTSSGKFLTPIAEPNQPVLDSVSPLSATSVKVTWKKPKLFTGPTEYKIEAKDSKNNTIVFKEQTTLANTSDDIATEVELKGLDEYWTYIISLNVTVRFNRTEYTEGPVTQYVTTIEATPEEVTDISIQPEQDVKKPRSIKVTWSPPTERGRNGIITAYFIHYQNMAGLGHETSIKLNSSKTNYTIEGIDPGNYTITIFAATKAGNGTSKGRSKILKPGAPIKIEETPGQLLIQESQTAVSDDEKQIAVLLPLSQFICNCTNGQPVFWGIVVSEAKAASEKPFFGDITDYRKILKSTYKVWSDGKNADVINPYVAYNTTVKGQACCTSNARRKRSVDQSIPESFVVGLDGDCAGRNGICNGELKPGRSYKVKAYTCTEGGCTETEYSKAINTAPNNIPAIVGGIGAAIALLVVVGCVVLLMRRRQMGCFAKSPENTYINGDENITEMKETPKTVHGFKPASILLADFPNYVTKLHKDSDLLFSDAYKMLKENSPANSTNVAELQSCRPKNRYTNILSFDHSRVKLRPQDDEEGSDYINANYIPGYTSRRAYVATQGPMTATFDDFWRMVWEQNVDTIVMLTRLVEKGRVKCDKYWPEVNEPVFYGDLVVSTQSESNLSDYTIRIIEIKLKNETRTVRQFCYLKWPDMGCPDHANLLLDFVKAVRHDFNPNRSQAGPMVVHCSAGVGRTGTFIAVDHLLQHIRDHDEVDIYNLVLEMRKHRCNMVQTEDQYIYIHECLKEFITSDDDEDIESDDPVYMNTNSTENVYENTAFRRD